jgi:hypothetical protein
MEAAHEGNLHIYTSSFLVRRRRESTPTRSLRVPSPFEACSSPVIPWPQIKSSESLQPA